MSKKLTEELTKELTETLTEHKIRQFQDTIWAYYHEQGRYFAWREQHSPYNVVVSEIMLQQTQTHRVIDKFEQFIGAFSSFADLADAPLADVLGVWQGLGYNRRAIALHTIAKKIVTEYDGELPNDPEILATFPGIGPATASSICAFAFNRPTAFIETNIRAVYIHFFFQDKQKVHDRDLMPLVEQTLNYKDPRSWYYGLMDYGVMLKKSFKNPSRKSVHYTKQSKFEGSDRQIRGMILRAFVMLKSDKKSLTHQQLLALVDREPERIDKALAQLCDEGFIKQSNNSYML